jgi:hypothetical protein
MPDSSWPISFSPRFSFEVVNNAVTNLLKVFGLNQQFVVDSFKWFHLSENRLTNQTQGHVVRGTG